MNEEKDLDLWGWLFLFLLFFVLVVASIGGYLYHQAQETPYEKCIEQCDTIRLQYEDTLEANLIVTCLDNCKAVK